MCVFSDHFVFLINKVKLNKENLLYPHDWESAWTNHLFQFFLCVMQPHFKIFQRPVIKRVSVGFCEAAAAAAASQTHLSCTWAKSDPGRVWQHCWLSETSMLAEHLTSSLLFSWCTPVLHNANTVVVCVGGSRYLAVSLGLGFNRSAL